MTVIYPIIASTCITLLRQKYDTAKATVTCRDYTMMLKILTLSIVDTTPSSTIAITDITFSTDEDISKSITSNDASVINQTYDNVFKSQAFVKRYLFFLKIMVFCLLMQVDLFMHNQMISFELLIYQLQHKKQRLLKKHMSALTANLNEFYIDPEYYSYVPIFVSKTAKIEKIVKLILLYCEHGIINKHSSIVGDLQTAIYQNHNRSESETTSIYDLDIEEEYDD